MNGARALAAACVIFVVGVLAAILGVTDYDDAYAWVAHSADVRLAIGRALGDSRSSPSCAGLRDDLRELARLTADNPIQQSRIPALGQSVATLCAATASPHLVDQLVEFDATERTLVLDRRARLAATRRTSIVAFAISMVGAAAAVLIARLFQRRAVSALGDSEARFRFLAASSSDLVRIHDPAGRPTYVSPSVERLLGYTPAELMTENPLSLGHPDDLPAMRETLVNVQQPHAASSTLVYRLRTKQGAYRWFETHTNPIRDSSGHLLRFYTTARDITERVEMTKQLERAAVTDELTGLLNRRGFVLIGAQELRVAMRQKHGVAVVFADLDGLKQINDQLGHHHGDRAICELAELLRQTFRESDVVARLGGDEFAALVYNVDRANVDAVLARVQAAVSRPRGERPYVLAVSLGVALRPPADQTSLEDLITEADERMYEAKRARKLGATRAALG